MEVRSRSPGVILSQCLRTRIGRRAAKRHRQSSMMLRGPQRSFHEWRLLKDAPAWTNTIFVGCRPMAVEMTKHLKGICKGHRQISWVL